MLETGLGLPMITSTTGRDHQVLTNGCVAEIAFYLFEFSSQETGDVNGDGTVNTTDVILLLNHVGNPAAHPIVNETAGDVNCNDVVNMGDMILLLNHVNDPKEYVLGC